MNARCPCCDHLTLHARGEYDVCPVCFWEDDCIEGPDRYSGANGSTLDEARKNFASYGASDPESIRWVQPPSADQAAERHQFLSGAKA